MNTIKSSKNTLFLQIIFILFVASNLFYAQNKTIQNNYKEINFEHLSIEHGLSQITVHAILQDSKGFLWFGTEDGLNRYDGYNFVTYRTDPNDSNSISDNFIWSLSEDNDGNIWIGTNDGGLNRYDYYSNKFQKYFKDQNIRKIFLDTENYLWLGTNNSGLIKFDYYNNKSNTYIKSDTENSISNNNIRDICGDDNGDIWIATYGGGINRLDKKNNIFEIITEFTNEKEKITVYDTWSVISEKNIIWIGSNKTGLIKYNTSNKKSKFYNFSPNKKSIANNNIVDLLIDKNDFLWICTENGLSLLNKKTDEIINYKHEPSSIKSLSDNFIRCVYQDKSNLIWLGTVGGGLNKINLIKKFKTYTHNPSDKTSISHNIIRAIHEDKDHNLWIGTLGNGLNKLDKKTQKFTRFIADRQFKSISNNNVASIFEDEKRNLWVGTWDGGLNKIQFSKEGNKQSDKIKKTTYFIHNAKNKNSISNNIVQAIYKDSKKNLWIGTEFGLNIFKEKQNKFIKFFHDPNNENSISDDRIQSNCIVEDKFGNIWIGTWNGLNKLSITNNNLVQSFNKVSFEKFKNLPGEKNSLSDNRVVSLYVDKVNSDSLETILWIGTIGGGLNKLEIQYTSEMKIKNKTISRFTEEDGLPNNVVYGILGDKLGNIWLSTNNGISKFNPEEKSFRNYDVTDGLQSNQFYWGAFHKTNDGELYFGGINGLNSFYPEELIENQNIPPIYITKSIISSSGNNVLEINPLSFYEQIELPYTSYTFNFEFAALDFVTPEKNKYEYKLDGYDESWSIPINKNSISYSNISDGEYTFKVRGSNNDGIWNTNNSEMKIIILTPFWKTWWFITMIVLSIIGLFTYFVLSQFKNMLALERLRTKLAADLHDNIGSSLTEISILSEVISTRLGNADKDVQKSLTKISTKSRSLIDKMSDIVWLVNPKRDSLYDLILRLQDTYSELLSETNISLRSENLKALENVTLQMEHRQHLFLIFKEALNNSITHSNCTQINLNAKLIGRKIEIELFDNGNGFVDNNDPRGNGLENMQNRAKTIGGELVLNSSLGKGTIVKYIGKVN